MANTWGFRKGSASTCDLLGIIGSIFLCWTSLCSSPGSSTSLGSHLRRSQILSIVNRFISPTSQRTLNGHCFNYFNRKNGSIFKIIVAQTISTASSLIRFANLSPPRIGQPGAYLLEIISTVIAQ